VTFFGLNQSTTTITMLLIAGFLACTIPVHADDIELNESAVAITQDQFNKTIRDLGVAMSYTPTEPAEAQGILGFNVGVELTVPEINDGTDYMKNTFENGDAPSTLFLPKVHVAKGLPFGLDASGFVSSQPSGNATLYGGALKYSLIEGGVLMPAVAVRGHATQLGGVDDLSLTTYGGDVSVSKGFDVPLILGFTPYAGYSHFQIDGNEDAGLSAISDHDTNEGRIFVGSRLSLFFFNLVAEADFGEVNLYSIRANIGF